MKTTIFGKKALVAAVVSMVLAFGFALTGCETTYEGKSAGGGVDVKLTISSSKYTLTYGDKEYKGDSKKSSSLYTLTGDATGTFESKTTILIVTSPVVFTSLALTKKSVDENGDEVYEFIIEE
ncbi:MAG: hypothetical protein Ta2G_05650 [Termitinemataceae bacterium]|nr:MAG: hypothetical protein Ta2G_05650 [Termitinemataceae bacterium]